MAKVVLALAERLLRSVAHALQRADPGPSRIMVRAYRGYGTERLAVLAGRVQEAVPEPTRILRSRRRSVRHLLRMLQHMTARPVPGAQVRAGYLGAEATAVADERGYFRIELQHEREAPSDRRWHPMDVELVSPRSRNGRTRSRGEIYVPPSHSRHVVISDIDDTVVETGVANKAKMIWRMLAGGAHSRTAFPGVSAFYRALHDGPGGDEGNPLLYVSRGPWDLYDLLAEFFRAQRIPAGPVLFLRDWGMSRMRLVPRTARDHKLKLIRPMLRTYSDLPVVLVGDSGQRDPETYAEVVREFPGRVKAVYIRNIDQDPERQAAVRALSEEVLREGSTLVLADDTVAMARHAAEHGLIDPERLAEVAGERREETPATADRTPPTPTMVVESARRSG